MVKYLLYVLRWVILAVPGALFFDNVRRILGIENVYAAMVISQAMLGAMVFFLDRVIFTSGTIPIPWETRPRVVCADCGQKAKCFRVAGERCCELPAESAKYPFRCKDCEIKKLQQMDD
jgi:hypothetical protein